MIKKKIIKKNVKKVYTYSSNNSGGSWWLKDKDWQALEDAGWKVQWGGLWFCNSNFNSLSPISMPKKCKKSCEGHQVCSSLKEVKEREAYFLGTPATKATKAFSSQEEAEEDFENITGQSMNEAGCPCCGSPHDISKEY